MNNLAGLLISKCRSHPFFTVFSVLIIGINSIVPRTIQVINAVTFKPDNDFSIHINGVRELLEPIVELPLFYLRAGQPIEEYIVLWIWIFISLGIYLIIKKGIRFYK